MYFDYSRRRAAMVGSSHWMREGSAQADVTVIGGGMAGMAAAIHLAKAGFHVVCLEAETSAKVPVGESLDWSAPALLADLGLPMNRLIGDDFATYKAKVIVQLPDGATRQYIPGDWLAKPPYNIELRTLHLDRVKVDAALREIILAAGVELLAGRAVEVEKDGRRVKAVRTESGQRLASAWFIDASGGAALFPRAFDLQADAYGPRKAAMWSYFEVQDTAPGTTLYMDGDPPYMEWIWEIPTHPNLISVGFVASGEAVRERRQQGMSVEAIFRERLGRIARFAELLRRDGAITPQVTSFQCRVYKGLAGPNWAIVGESASMVDPLTSNGVTAALRHAAESSAMMVRAAGRGQLPYLARTLYSKRIVDVSRFFNCGIEKVIYDRPVRKRVGVLTAGRIYTVPAWVLNAVYPRLKPKGLISTVLFGFILDLFRAASVVLSFLCREAA
jgi:flavin-dependent dehydrogenase